MKRAHDLSRTIDLFSVEREARPDAVLNWPDGARFPLNAGGLHVRTWVWSDLIASRDPLIIAGYASLDHLIDLVTQAKDAQSIRLLFGHEPFDSRREQFDLSDAQFTEEVEAYWLERGISLFRSAALIKTIELLKAGEVQARYVSGGRGLHAKIYCGQDAASLGSSNFTEPGLHSQLEANVRFTRTRDKKRFDEVSQIAENYWSLGREYTDDLIALLEKLLKRVDWDEALARACAELLEGEWAQAYLREQYLGDAGSLWPSQKQGIGQALYVLSNQGSVLIADATGAGKTRMGTYLIGAVRDQILRSGRVRQGKGVMICPPAVEDNWRHEAMLASLNLEVYSHGSLSNETSRHHDLMLKELQRAQVLCVDESHNFLNLKSNRARHVLRNMADHVILQTATPINRSVKDLLRVADLLGADNLADSTLDAFKKLLRAGERARTLTEAEIEQLRREIQRFTVRRTKKALNALIDREPDAYRDKDGRRCRFPTHNAQVYALNESSEDRAIALRIRELADGLCGMTHFVRPIEMPEALRREEMKEQHYLQGRINSACKLARYVVMKALRSSRAALVEHILGTDAALEKFEISRDFSKDRTGNQIGTLQRIAGTCPKNLLSIPLPDWLSNADAHRAACEEERRRYEEISKLALEISDRREHAKADKLKSLLDQHPLLLAFDSRPISLAVIRQLIGQSAGLKVLLASGDKQSDRQELLRDFAHGSKARHVIGLCSDSLSEGVNLQQASALAHLDMPSVVRLAEQRVGRVDRMDSPHEIIEAWWPDDAPEFALSSDDLFIERFETVERLIGSNMPLPQEWQERASETVTARQMIARFEEQHAKSWDGIDDAFAPVRRLVDGSNALITAEVYERYRRVAQRVLSRVSPVTSSAQWGFFCIKTGSFGAPRWILMPSYNAPPELELAKVSDGLRKRLTADVKNLPLDDCSMRVLQRFLQRLPEIERQLLSRKKQRALDQLESILAFLATHASQAKQQAKLEHVIKLQQMLSKPPPEQHPDWDKVASRWLDLIRPVWFERLAERHRNPLQLKDVTKDLKAKPDWVIEMLEYHFRHFPVQRTLEQRISACIIGVA